ncbi:HNH endonuclease signature motif containing protein [Bacillus sp. B-jedd]|uniref:HNH endonuclease signature motif containing protein n=1 Tax=Bacillus sp. B-jedd TaxID=1476857 RepID=UPI0005156DFC|nr:HNH endonuclease signature motif containing protein [Bacillus sp. B-jedd]CEG26000.1 HNH endonuclease [Bacillus sp. B-jedd]
MLKSCSYCGGIHDRKYQCPSKPKRNKQPTYIDKFRWTRAWQKKRKHINERDKYMCQVCIRELFNTQLKYNFTDIEVHHITSIAEDWNSRLDDDNLICLCSSHHKMAEVEEIPKALLYEIVEKQEKMSNR